MRALCGAIITAGALIGLGLATLGVGLRYANHFHYDSGNARFDDIWVHFFQMDTALVIAMLVLLITLGVGLATAFLGLAFHHERRHREHLIATGQYPHHRPLETPRATTP
jgi:heme/copper-type cytochrome/quinol oxidase subunit 2